MKNSKFWQLWNRATWAVYSHKARLMQRLFCRRLGCNYKSESDGAYVCSRCGNWYFDLFPEPKGAEVDKWYRSDI